MKKNTLFETSDGKNYILPFILVTLCFALWGFANDITNPMVKAFSKIFRMSVTDGALVQMAFYGGYFAMALPAALFVRRFSYKSGLMMGLGLYAVGALMFIPAKALGSYYPFLIAYFILTCGLSFLETSANPYILAMGSPETATRRLNLAQAFNPIGSLMGMYVAMHFIQSRMSALSTADRAGLGEAEFEALKQSDLAVVVGPYAVLGLLLVAIFLAVFFVKMPSGESMMAVESDGSSMAADDEACRLSAVDSRLSAVFGRLWRNIRYREGVVAQFFYVGAQIMCWTFIIQYGTRVFMGEGMAEQAAEILSQKYNMVAMCCFCASRFVCTYLLRFVNPGKLLSTLSLVAIALLLCVIFLGGRTGLNCLVAVSACMSLMFPTIYGISLEGVGEGAKIGAAGLIMAILGGSILPPLQARIIDLGSVSASFAFPLFCFVVIALYGFRHSSAR